MQPTVCHQYDIRVKNRSSDLVTAGLTEDDVVNLRVPDFVFAHEDKDEVWEEARNFIELHEWLGRMSLYPTNIFTARYKGILAGVIVMDMPNAFSKMLGDDTRKMERLISRGACISWSPKNLASSLIMFSVKWMVHNTRFRLFTCYSDTEAGEIGTIYQACGFKYLGAKFGAKKQYMIPSGRWVSDRYFRSRSVYKRLARNEEIPWRTEWQVGDKVIFDNMPEFIADRIKELSKSFMMSCPVRELPPKGKYAYVLGKNKKETKELRKIFEERVKVFPYPKR